LAGLSWWAEGENPRACGAAWDGGEKNENENGNVLFGK
jgi:hypothetical protein